MVCSFVRYIRYSTDFFFSPPRCRHHRCFPPPHHPSSHRPGPGAEAKQKQKQVKQKDAGRDRVAATCIISPVQSKLQPSIFIPPTFYLPTYPPTLYVSPYLTIPYILPIILPVLILRYVVASTPDSFIAFIISSCHSKCCPPPPVYARASPLCQQLQNHTFFFLAG
ncbi:hypothetical protein B9Z19DRAFT_1087764, partial [Tuber borchii]